MTWRSEKYKRAAAYHSRKETFRRKWIRGLRAQKAQFDLEFPVIKRDGVTSGDGVRYMLEKEAKTHTQTHMRAKEGLAGLNGRISGEGQ
jgi:hypothetical protein